MGIGAYLLVFLGIYIIYLLFVVSRKKARESFKKSCYVLYLVNVYKIDVDKINTKMLASMVTCVNSFILATTLYILSNIKGILSIVVAAFSMLLLLFILYHVLGKILKRKGDKNV